MVFSDFFVRFVPSSFRVFVILWLFAGHDHAAAVESVTPSAEHTAYFEQNVRPLLVETSACVASGKRKARPRLVTATALASLGSSRRGSKDRPATIRSLSSSLKSFCTGSP